MIQLIYISRARQQISQSDLLNMLEDFRANNQRMDVTGLLLYDGKGAFIQVIEGDEPEISALFGRIKQDERHEQVHLLGLHPIQQREFPDWQMGFKLLTDYNEQDIPGLSHFLEQVDPAGNTHEVMTFAKELLTFFRQGISDNPEEAPAF